MINKAHDRTIALLGKEQFQILRESKVLIVGVGGVGGYAVETLVRAGIGKLVLVDFDDFEESNLNRQLGALQQNIGKSKVHGWYQRIQEIHPEILVDAYVDRVTSTNIDTYIKDMDMILDMCDDLNAKVAMIHHAASHGIPIISAMGAGNRIDISHLKFTTLDKTRYCPLAKRLRKLVDLSEQKVTPVLYYDNEIYKSGDIVGTISYAPAYMGIRAGAEAIQILLKGGFHDSHRLGS
ncbi:MAG: ThiF family adenylyltransferase [Tissierellia bacterium]|nr:ThiF family adenylyltransferase [Tissierellia bacterium]